MRISNLLAMSAVLLFLASVGRSAIISAPCNADGDVDATALWNSDTYTMNMQGSQSGTSGGMIGDFVTDTEVDPTVTMANAMDNDTGFTWTGYTVKVLMNKTFTLSDPVISYPGDWTAAITQQPVLDGSWYVGIVTFTAGTPVGVGDSIAFNYKATFIGSVEFCQEMIPTPEPATLALLAMGGLTLLRRRR